MLILLLHVAVVDMTSVPKQAPNPTLLPGWSSWSEWSDCNTSSALSTNTQTRSRSCRLDRGMGDALLSIEPCLLLEQAGGDLEVRDCENMSTVTILSSRVLEEGEIVSNDISVDMTVQPPATSSSSSVDIFEGNTVTMQTTILKRTTEHLHVGGDNTTLINSSRSSSTMPVMGE